MTDIPSSSQTSDFKPDSWVKQEPHLSSEKPKELSEDSHNIEQSSVASQLLLVPTRTNGETTNKPIPRQHVMRPNGFFQKENRDLFKLRPVNRRPSNASSRFSEGPFETEEKPLSEVSSKWTLNKKSRQFSYQHGFSPARSGTINISRSIGKPEETSIGSHSNSYSGLHQIHQMYHDINENRSGLGLSAVNSSVQRYKKNLAHKVKDTYYRLLKKRFARRGSFDAEDNYAFNEQIDQINESIRIPNEERIADLKLEEMNFFERLDKYKDKFPFLEQRKKIMRIGGLISHISYNIITNPIFDIFILTIIIINSILFAFDNPTTTNDDWILKADNFFLAIYTIEMALKICGLGFILNRHSYLRDPWNILDFAIVVTSYIPIFFSGTANLKALRALRAIRPLKTISSINSLRVIVLALLAAIKPLMETFLILFFFLLIFAIIGLQLFSGALKQRCFSVDEGISLMAINDNGELDEKFCSNDGDCGVVAGITYICGKMTANPDHEVTNFDTFGNSLLMAFQIVTTEGWSDIMQRLQQTFSPFAVFYFILLIFIGNFFLLNLTLAVIKAEFTANSRLSISRWRKKPTFDERLMLKLKENKLDVLRLIHRLRRGEISYSKYQFKKDQLVAVEKSLLQRALTLRKRRDALKRSESQTGVGSTFSTAILRLRNTLANMKKPGVVVKSRSTIYPESRTDVGTNLDVGSLAALDKENAKTEGPKLQQTIGSREELLNSSLEKNTPASTPFSSRFKNFFKSFKSKGPLIRKHTSVTSPGIVHERQESIRETFTNLEEANPHPSRVSPRQDSRLSTESNVQVFKQQRGFGDLQIRITDASAPVERLDDDDDKEEERVPESVVQTPQSVFPSHGRAYVHSVIEEEDISEASPSKGIPNSAYRKRPRERRRFMGKEKEPVRPLMSERMKLKTDDVNRDEVEMINIAGIRNRQVAARKEGEEAENNGEEVPIDDQAIDQMNDEEWFLEFLKTQEQKSQIGYSGNPQNGSLLKKMNRIRALAGSHKKIFGRPRSGLGSDAGSHRKGSKISTILGSEDFEGDYSKNSHSQKRGSSIQRSSNGFVEDSDFAERRKKNSKSSEDPEKKRQRGVLRRKATMAKRGLKRGMTIQEIHEEAEEGNEEKEEENSKLKKAPALRKVENIEQMMMTEEDVIEIEEIEKHMILDLKKLKVEPIKEREYQSNSLDEVLPSRKDQELKRQVEEEMRKLKENRLKMDIHITRAEKLAALEKKHEIERVQKQELTSLAIMPSEKAVEIRKQEEAERLFDDEIDAAIEGMKARNNEKGGSSWGMKFALRRLGILKDEEEIKKPEAKLPRKNNRFNFKKKEEVAAEEQEEEVTEDQRKDFFFVLRKLQTPFDNEKENEESEEFQKKMRSFEFQEDYRSIRRRDLEENKIGTSNWSGNSVLPMSYQDLATDKVKKALNVQDWDIWRRGVLGVVHGMRRKTYKFVHSAQFNTFIMLTVFFNTIILATVGLIKNSSVNQVLTDLNTVFSIIFVIEMALKLFALGITKYARDSFNLLDAFVTIVSLIETIIDSQKNSAMSAFRALRLLRTLRILRVTKLLRSLAFMKIIIGVIIRSLKNFIFVLTILLLFIFIYSLLGMQLFGDQLNFPDNIGPNRTRQNFDSFINAFMTVFQIMTVENWQNILYLVYRSSITNFLSISYLVSWIFIGNFIFLNLFLALLLDEFSGEEVEEELEELEAEEEAPVTTQASSLTKKSSRFSLSHKPISKEISNMKSASSFNSASLSLTDFESDKEESFVMYKNVTCSRSLYLFPKTNPIRKACYVFAKHRSFEIAILVVISISCIKLILDTYIPNDATTLTNVSNAFDYVFLGIFVIEALAKIISSGFVFNRNSYLRDGWNILDFVIVIVSFLDVILSSSKLSWIRALRLLRALRPLRFISHNQNMKIVVIALLESVGAMFNVLVVVLIIWIMFAILAANLVGDQFGYCSGLPAGTSYYGIGILQCASMGHQWRNFNANFDNVFQGLLTLFIVSTQEDWPDIMYRMVDTRSADQGPAENANRAIGNLYFIVFIFIGSYFLVNLFIGVIFLNFTRAHQQVEFRHKFLTPDQRKWLQLQRLILFTKPDLTVIEPKTEWRKPFFKLIRHAYFEYFIMISIALNVLVMALAYEGSASSYSSSLDYINYFFTGVFALEMALKITGLGIHTYLSSRWNKFDAVVVFVSFIEILVQILDSRTVNFLQFGPQLARVFRIFRVMRLLKLVRRFKGLKKLINTLVFSLPALLNIGALLVLINFIFSLMGTFLFKDVARGDIVNDYFHFKDFWTATLTLFRASTGEDWWYIMFDTLYPAGCVEGVESCGTNAAIPFWVVFILICQFIFLNLFILVVIQQFEEYHFYPNNPVTKFREKLQSEFNPTWQLLSARHQGTRIHEKQLIPFFMSMNPPLGFRGLDLSKKEVALEITSMNLTLNSEGMVFYNDVLHACMKRIYGHEDLIGNPKFLAKQDVKVKRKLEQIKRKLSYKRSDSITPGFAAKSSPINPIFKILFMEVTMKCWINYSKRVMEKMKAARDQGVEYIPSESDEDDYTEIQSEEDNFSSPSIENDFRDIYEEDEEEPARVKHSNNKIHSHEESQIAVSHHLHSEDEKESNVHSREANSIRKRQQRDDYRWVIHKESPGYYVSPNKNYPDHLESSDRYLLHRTFGVKTPFRNSASPKKQRGRIDSLYDGSPGRLSPLPTIRGECEAESAKSIFDFWDGEKLSNISPGSKRGSVKEDFLFEHNLSHIPVTHPFVIKTPNQDSGLAVPSLKQENRGSMGLRLNVNRQQAVENYEKAEKDFLNIPISLSRNTSKMNSDGASPPSSKFDVERFFPAADK